MCEHVWCISAIFRKDKLSPIVKCSKCKKKNYYYNAIDLTGKPYKDKDPYDGE